MEIISDGSSFTESTGVGLILTSPIREEINYTLRFDFQTSNNESEYKELIIGLLLAIKLGCEHIHASINSMVFANQTNGLYKHYRKNSLL